jgi:hypothetical protein
MKLYFRITLLTALFCHVAFFGQNISDDSLMKIANQEIYNNPDQSISIGKTTSKRKRPQ